MQEIGPFSKQRLFIHDLLCIDYFTASDHLLHAWQTIPNYHLHSSSIL